MIEGVKESRNRILMFGFGELGRRILGHLLTVPERPEIWVASRDGQVAERWLNSTVYAARQLGHDVPRPQWRHSNLEDVEQTSHLIGKIQPTYVVNATTLQSWWVQGLLPAAASRRLDEAQVGPWLPVHLWLTTLLADACILAGRSAGIVINCSFPDVVNPVLATQGKSPLMGIGNVANNEPALTQAAASMLGVAYTRLRVRMLMHHYVSHRISRHGDAGGAPFHLSVYLDGAEVTDLIDVCRLLYDLPLHHKRMGGREGQVVTAASAVRVLRGLMSAEPIFAHAPGVFGLPGGYPIVLSNGVVKLDLPNQLTESEAERINRLAQPYEGIKSIAQDGSVTFEEENAAVMFRELGYDCSRLAPADVRSRAYELLELYARYASRVSDAEAPVCARP